MRTSRALALAVLLTMPSALWAQRGPLDQVETRVANAELDAARALLHRWRTSHPGADPEDLARYHLLSARLTSSADTAEDNYLTIALTYPTARVAPEALLRLAQARLARGDSAQAIQYLERLLSDYPNSDPRTLGAVWLARARSSSAAKAELCSLLRGVEPGTNPETVQYLRAELTRFCGSAAAVARTAARPPRAIRDTTTPAPPRVVRDTSPRAQPRVARDTSARAQPRVVPDTSTRAQPRAQPPRTPAAAPAPAGRVTIQVGAFRELSGAQSVKRQLERAGFTNIRLVRVPGNQLIRVRIGKFADRPAAAAVLAALARADISAVLVSDAHTETSVKQ
jgi:hypothetical protein